MRVPDSSERGSATFNMTPMIDVVFLLIIFFLVSSHLAKQENHLELELPTAESAEKDPIEETPRITINVKEDGEVLLGSRSVAKDDLQKLLQRELSSNGIDMEVRIRGSRAAQYSVVEPIMVACAKAGIWNVKYAVYEKKGK